MKESGTKVREKRGTRHFKDVIQSERVLEIKSYRRDRRHSKAGKEEWTKAGVQVKENMPITKTELER